MSGKYKPLLPAPAIPGASSGHGLRGGSRPPDEEQLVRRKRSLVRIACSSCRAKKIACDGRRPICAACAKRELECSYDAEVDETRYMALRRENESLKTKHRQIETLFEKIRLGPDNLTTDVLGYVKDGVPPESILSLLQQAPPNRTPPSSAMEVAPILPVGPPSLKLELMVTRPNAYPPLIPLDVSNIDLALLGIKPILRHRTNDEQTPSAYSIANSIETEPHAEWSTSSIPSISDLHTTATDSNHALNGDEIESWISYVDERLYRVQISAWTKVPITAQFAAEALAVYFVNEHPILAPFDSSLFLDSFLSGDTRFCSSLLANALLAYSCQGYTYFESSAALSFRAFLQEASQLWEHGQELDSIATVSAGILLSLIYNSLGQDQKCLIYLAQSTEIARRLGLFNILDELPASPCPFFADADHIAAASTVAWSIFNWHQIRALNMHQASSFLSTPFLPIPGDDKPNKGKSSAASPELRTLPAYMGRTLRAATKLCILIAEMQSIGYQDASPIILQKAEQMYQKLLQWSDEIPFEAGRNDVRHYHSLNSHVVILHIWYHNAILDLVRPLCEPGRQTKLQNFASPDDWPTGVQRASMDQLMHLIYIYRSSFSASKFSGLHHCGMLYVLNYVLSGGSKPEALFYFYLCMRGYQSLLQCYPYLLQIVRGVLAMAIRDNAISPVDACNLFDDISTSYAAAGDRSIFAVDSLFPIDRNLALTDRMAASVEALARAFDRSRASTDPADGF